MIEKRLLRFALGASFLEPSEEDEDKEISSKVSEAELRNSQRESEFIRAQHEILRCVGVTDKNTVDAEIFTEYKPEHHAIDEEVLSEVRAGLVERELEREKEIMRRLSTLSKSFMTTTMAFHTLNFLATSPLYDLRCRIQTFRSSRETSYWELASITSQSSRASLYAGIVPSALCEGIEYLIKALSFRINANFGKQSVEKSPTSSAPASVSHTSPHYGLLPKLGRFLMLGGMLLALYPLREISTAQSLHLLPPRPFLPTLQTCLSFYSSENVLATLSRFAEFTVWHGLSSGIKPLVFLGIRSFVNMKCSDPISSFLTRLLLEISTSFVTDFLTVPWSSRYFRQLAVVYGAGNIAYGPLEWGNWLLIVKAFVAEWSVSWLGIQLHQACLYGLDILRLL